MKEILNEALPLKASDRDDYLQTVCGGNAELLAQCRALVASDQAPWPLLMVADSAFAQLERAFAEHSDTIAILRAYPLLESLRGDPRFADLVRRVDEWTQD